jgi:hemoglobin/transferrin/lactoferrin receptor protein
LPRYPFVRLAGALGAALGACMTHAQTPAPAPAPTPAPAPAPASAAAATVLPAITNTATRTARRVDDVPATVTVVRASEIESAGARDIKDLFRNQVDLSVRAAPGRFGAAGASTGRAGNEGLNIRGLEGNQVLMVVDGIRVPSSFSFGAFATGRADYLALETTQAVDVLRGPASTSFGSDGLAGAISLRTLEPADLLQPGRATAGFVRASATGLDDSRLLTLAAASELEAWRTLWLVSQRIGHQTDSKGTLATSDASRTAPNPVSYRQSALLGKTQLQVDEQHQLKLTLELMQRDTHTDVLSARAAPAANNLPLPATAVLGLTAQDRVQRRRLSLNHLFTDLNHAWAQQASTQVFAQSALSGQFAAEDRNTATDRTRLNRYREGVIGLTTQLESNLTAPWAQRLTYGLDISRTVITAVRDGIPSPSAAPPFGEAFPVKPFPDTAYVMTGAFVQSESTLNTPVGPLSLIPGVRFDRYQLRPSADGYSAGDAVALAGSAVTPRLGAVWRIAAAWAPYAQVSTGFRAPAPGQVNNGFTNVAAGYQSIGNSQLKAEAAHSLEVGLRGHTSSAAGADNRVQWQLAAFDNRYREFISQEAVRGSGTTADPTIFQFINLARARIRGVELRGAWRLGGAWTLKAASALTRGTSTRGGVAEALDSVEPARTALGLGYEAGAWVAQVDVLHAQGKSTSRVRAATPVAFAPAGYTVVDLSARWFPGPDWTLAVNLNNATNATYWRWSDVRGLADNSPVKDAYTAPGRHLQVTLRHDF